VANQNERLTLTVDEASKVTGIGRDSMRRLVNEGTVPSIRIGRKYLIPKARLEAWLAGPVGGAA